MRIEVYLVVVAVCCILNALTGSCGVGSTNLRGSTTILTAPFPITEHLQTSPFLRQMDLGSRKR